MSVTAQSADSDLWDLLPDGVVIADAAGRVLLCNGVARRVLAGWPATGEGLATIPLQDTDGRDWFSVARPYEGLPSRVGVPVQSWLGPAGDEVLVRTRLNRSRPGLPIEQVALTIRPARGNKLLDRQRSDLVATVAHELRSPLTGVRGFVTTLLNRWDRLNDDQKKLMLTTVNADAERLSRLIVELLDVARIDTGRLPLYPREVVLKPIIDRAVESARAGQSREILSHYEDPEVAINADPDKFIQVITNVLENAVRHGEGRIVVDASPDPENPDMVRIVVDDEGEGIPEAIRRRAFTKFWRHGHSGGSGLGLYIVNGLTRAHEGNVRIADAPGGGARIVLTWPVPAD